MKIVFLGDTHWGARGNSEYFLNKQIQFYRNVFFPYLVENKIDTVIQMGDLLDQRKFINVKVMYNLRREYLQKFEDLKIKHYVLVGNHDVVHNNTNKISALVEIAGDGYEHTVVVEDPQTLTLAGLSFDLIPWINRENEASILEFMQLSSSDYLVGHLEINGFEMVSGITCKDGLEGSIFKQYKEVYSGHFHRQSKIHNIRYLGTPYQMNWGDYGDDKGFWVFDTETQVIEHIKNPDQIYHKIVYDDKSVDYDTFDVVPFTDTIMKIVVESKENDMMFDRFVSNIQKVVYDLLISDLDSFDVTGTDIEKMDIEDSLSILLKTVDGMNTNVDKISIKNKINEIHREAEDLMLSE